MKDENVFRAAGAMTGGIGGMHDACGALLGASLFFGQAAGRMIKDFPNKDKLQPSMRLTGQLYKWYEKEYGSPTCYDIRTKFGGGVYYEMSVPWQAELAKEARLHEQCTELAGKTAAQAAEMIWEIVGSRE